MTQTIQSVDFLVPCRITILENGATRRIHAEVDYKNQVLYVNGIKQQGDFANDVFSHLTKVSLPEDEFASDDELSAEAAKAHANFEKVKVEHLGEVYE